MKSHPSIAIIGPNLEVPGGQGVQVRAIADGLRTDGYSVMVLPISPLRWLKRVRYLRTLLNEVLYIWSLRHLRKVDVIHVFSASYWSFLLAPVPVIVIGRLLRKPVILHYHSGEAADHFARWPRTLAFFLPMVDEIVVPSLYLQSVFAAHGYRSRVIPNAIDTQRFVFRERTQLRPSLLSVRNLEPHYRVDNTLRAFARLRADFPEATLTIAGVGSQRQTLQRLAINGVQFIGSVDQADLPAVYDAADIFVNSSVVDNQPVSILEAFACGLPVISTPPGDIPTMLRDGAAGILVEGPQAMADAIARLLNDPESALQMSKRARNEVERYAWSHVGELWSAVYADALETDTQKVHGSHRVRLSQ